MATKTKQHQARQFEFGSVVDHCQNALMWQRIADCQNAIAGILRDARQPELAADWECRAAYSRRMVNFVIAGLRSRGVSL